LIKIYHFISTGSIRSDPNSTFEPQTFIYTGLMSDPILISLDMTTNYYLTRLLKKDLTMFGVFLSFKNKTKK